MRGLRRVERETTTTTGVKEKRQSFQYTGFISWLENARPGEEDVAKGKPMEGLVGKVGKGW